MKQKVHKPWEGLIALIVSLLLAVACGTGYMAATKDKAKQLKQWQQTNQILFLSTALQLHYQDLLAESNSSKPDYITGTEDGTAISDMINTVLLLVNNDGSVLDHNSFYANSCHSDKVYIQWRNGIGCFMYNEDVVMAEKFNVIVYDREHLDGGAVAQGSFGYPFTTTGKLEESLNNFKVTEDMYIFIDTDWKGNKRYLISVQNYNTEMPSTSNNGQLMDFDDAWRNEAKNLLGLGFLLFLALYWLGLAYWVYLDARRRMMRADAWTIAVFITNIAGFAVYLLAARTKARREAAKTCTACGGSMLRAYPCCPWCGEPRERRCPACGADMKDGWIVCPHCGGTPKAAEPKPQALMEPPAIVPEPIVVLPKEEARAPKQEEEAAIPLIFQDGSPFNHN